MAKSIRDLLLTVTVVDTSGRTSFTRGVVYEHTPPREPIQVNCPPVAEPNVTYSCSFAYKGSDAYPQNTNFTITYSPNDDVSTEVSFPGVGKEK